MKKVITLLLTFALVVGDVSDVIGVGGVGYSGRLRVSQTSVLPCISMITKCLYYHNTLSTASLCVWSGSF